MKRSIYVVVAVIATAAVIGACYAPVQPQPGPDAASVNTAVFRAVDVINDLSVGDDATITGDATVTGNTTIAGTLNVTGGITGTNVLTTGDQTIAGTKTFSDTATFSDTVTFVGATTVGGGYGSTGCSLSAAGVLQCNGAATTDGALTADSAVIGGGYGSTGCTLTNAGILQCNGAATFGGAVTTGLLNSLTPVLVKGADYPIVAADSGAIIKASGTITLTMPSAAVGLNVCIINYDGGDLVIDWTDATDVAINEVNSAGDRVTNTTALDNICLTAIDTTNWMTVSSLGTWSDGN